MSEKFSMPEGFFSVEHFKDEAFEQAQKDFPKGKPVYITSTRAIGFVEEVRASADGPCIKVTGKGSIPIAEIRPATKAEFKKYYRGMKDEEMEKYLKDLED